MCIHPAHPARRASPASCHSRTRARPATDKSGTRVSARGRTTRSPARASPAPTARPLLSAQCFPPHLHAPSLAATPGPCASAPSPQRPHCATLRLTCRARSSASSSLLSFPAAQQQPAANLAVTLARTLYGTPPRDPRLHPLNATAPSLCPRLANSATRTLAATPLGSTVQDLCTAVNPPPRYSLAPAVSRRSSAPCPGSSPSSLPRSPVPALPDLRLHRPEVRSLRRHDFSPSVDLWPS